MEDLPCIGQLGANRVASKLESYGSIIILKNIQKLRFNHKKNEPRTIRRNAVFFCINIPLEADQKIFNFFHYFND